jgi:hypothetical protein
MGSRLQRTGRDSPFVTSVAIDGSRRERSQQLDRSVGGFAGWFAGLDSLEGLLSQQALQLGPRLVNQGSGELLGRFLPFFRELSHSHVEQRNIVFEPAEGPLDLGNAEVIGEHVLVSPVIFQSAMNTVARKLKGRYPGPDGVTEGTAIVGKSAMV